MSLWYAIVSMIPRHLLKQLLALARKYPIVTLLGPRQSGKTILTQLAFPNYQYVSLEDLDQREFALHDPRGFLEKYNRRVILDEIQRVPSLFSYLQTQVDMNPEAARFILTGSHQFQLNEKISQTLTGRTVILKLFPFSLAEICRRVPQLYWVSGKLTKSLEPSHTLYYYLFHGFYPRIYDKKLPPRQFYRDYLETYVTREVRELVNIGDLSKFDTFLRLLAGRTGQRVNLTSLGNDAGLSHPTIKKWLSILEASYVIHLLLPHFENFHKRLMKSPKIYFLDTGLLCYLLRIQSVDDLYHHPYLGAIFESFVFSEIYKTFSHQSEEAPLYFWQDRVGHEIDLLIDQGRVLFPIEIKASKTLIASFFKYIQSWFDLPGNKQKEGCLVYGGNEWMKRKTIQIIPWYGIS